MENNKKINIVESSIYKNISKMSRYVSKKNDLFESIFDNLSKKYFDNEDSFEKYSNDYFSSISGYSVIKIDLDKMYCEFIKHILTNNYFKQEFSQNIILSNISLDDLNKCYNIRLVVLEDESYHGSCSPDYIIKMELNTPETIEILSNIYNKIHHTSFNIDYSGKLSSSKNHSVINYLCHDNFDDNNVNFDFSDYLKNIKEAIKNFNLSIGKLKLN
jgi:hypothetical protein